MYDAASLLKKAAKGSTNTALSLAALQSLSFPEIRKKFENELSWSEARHLYREAQEQLKNNKILESRIFTRANPQLPQAIRSGIQGNAASRSYDDMFGSRSSSFVKSGSVASMFSPAGYLTELYREAKGLHAAGSVYNLDVRRPDLAGLLLSQENMDEEISTLALSNDIMLRHVEKKTGISGDELLEHFSTDRFSAATPYHQPYETLRQSVLTLDPELDALTSAPDVLSQADPASLLSIITNISPTLHDILVEDITAENAAALYAKNFSIPAGHFNLVSNIRDYYNLSEKEQAAFLGGGDSLLFAEDNLQQEGAVYVEGRLTSTVVGENGSVVKYVINVRGSQGYNTFNYLELIPLGNLEFNVNFNFSSTLSSDYTDLRIHKNYRTSSKQLLHRELDFDPSKEFHSRKVTLDLDDILNGVDITVTAVSGTISNKWTEGAAFFNIQEMNLNAYILKLNKAIRLCRAADITPEQLESLIYNAGTDGKIDESVISLLFTALYFRKKYNIDIDDALVLAGGNISQFIGSAGISRFDQIFNTPVLAGEWFIADGSEISLLPAADDASFTRDSLLRGLAATRGELYQLGLMSGLITASDAHLELTLKNVSTLYRLSLIARLNSLSVNELYMLFTISPFPFASSSAFVLYFYQLSHWMAGAGLSAAEVWMLTSAEHPQTLTPEMLTLRSTIAAAVSAQDVSAAASDAARRRLIAPYIAGTLGLSSPDLAASLVFWCENDGHFALDVFLELLLAETLKPADETQPSQEEQLAGYLHVLAQYSLTVQALSLSEAEVNVLAGIHGARQLLPDVAQSNALERLMSLHYFHQWLNTLGQHSSAVLAALNEDKLTTALMASAIGVDEAVLTQALSCVQEGASDQATLSDWQTIYQILQWVNVATALNTMPAVVKQLVDIRLSATTAGQPSWNEWKNLSRSLEAALTPHRAATLAATAAGRLSDVLCSWFLGNVKTENLGLRSRDDLYSYFLIDNQVSAEVKTTRVAEAISGIQLYINRALNRIELDVVTDVSTRQFFTDWEMNSRYSTWGGVSRLAYYPENYVNQLQRIGQTKMMDELLQNINQSQLSQDTVEDAFKTYLARFEAIADLKVISAYHDNVNSYSGKTWFIGRGREAVSEYYWRHVELSTLTNGVLPANAWTEWRKIEAPILAWGDNVRPVIFHNRLHVVWLERDETAKNGTNTPEMLERYTLKIIFLKHDGNWSSPWSYDITDVARAVSATEAQTGLTVSYVAATNSLCTLVYKKATSYAASDFLSTSKVNGLLISGDMVRENISNLSHYNSLHTTFDLKDTDNIPGVKKANYMFAVNYALSSGDITLDSAAGEQKFTIISNGRASGIEINKDKDNKDIISIKSNTFNIKYAVSNSQLMENQLKMIKQQSAGDRYLLHSKVSPSYGSTHAIPIYNITAKTIRSSIQGSLGWQGVSSYMLYQGSAKVFDYKSPETYSYDRSADFSSCDKNEIRLWRTYWDGTGAPVTEYMDAHEATLSGLYELDTSVNNSTTGITVRSGSYSNFYKASDYALPLPAVNYDMTYVFGAITVRVEDITFNQDIGTLDIEYSAKNNAGKVLGKTSGVVKINKVNYSPDSILQICETGNGVQFMQHDLHRIRLNTLLAPQLVSLANTGISAILSMETQQLPEYQLGEGFFADFTLPAYNFDTHGSSRAATIIVGNINGSENWRDYWSGILTDSQTVVRLFIPYSSGFYLREGVKIAVEYGQKSFSGTWEPAFIYRRGDGKNDYDSQGKYLPNDGHDEGEFVLINDKDYTSTWTQSGMSSALKYKGYVNVTISSAANAAKTTPLDFNSSSALYYWELFYYVPMMCFRRFLQESKFEEARTWMNYVWNPNGYIVNGDIAPWVWNCRPLEEATSWNANPLDAIDPDAVAQNDPTHYKVATFMSFIELLVARGDMCYRELTRDALAEAKMWYVFALNLMGDEPQDHGTAAWSTPSLASAASETPRVVYQDLLATIKPDITLPVIQGGDDACTDETPAADAVSEDVTATDGEDVQARTANSLAGLFQPEYNPALTEMWSTLRLRLYNLRNNLSIDGQPLSLAIYDEPADPAALLSSMVQTSAGGAVLPKGMLSLYRFPVMLERARNLVNQLTQFGSSLLSMAEHDDADAFSILLMQQGMELMTHSIRLQQRSVEEIKADIATMKVTLTGAQGRLDKYTHLYDEDVSTGERQAMALADTASALTLAGQAMGIIGGAADLVPNTFGLANGGARWGALSTAMATGMGMQSASTQIAADKVSRSEMYRRRREEWEIQRNNAQSEVDQIEAQLAGMAIRLEAANMQVDYLETQQGHTLAQLEFMQRKFTNQALYSWMRGKLSAIYYQFFDIAQSCCLMAQEALRRELNDNSVTFIRGSAWNGATAGFMAGETLLLNLAEMDKAWMERDERALEVTRTVSLAQVYAGLADKNDFILKDKLSALLKGASATGGNEGNDMVISGETLLASVKLSDLKIKDDYPADVLSGKDTRCLKQISVTLPALVGPYEDVRAVLSYGGSVVIPRGCSSIAISHGMNDSGQFQLDFNDARYLPFEGIPVEDTGSLTLCFPDATARQKALLESLNDIILHIRYTIKS